MIWSNSCNGIYLECPFENKFPTVWGLFLGGCWVLFLKGSLETYSKGSSWNKLVSICLHTGFPALTSSSPLKGTGDRRPLMLTDFQGWIPPCNIQACSQFGCLGAVVSLKIAWCVFTFQKGKKNPPLQTDSERQAAGWGEQQSHEQRRPKQRWPSWSPHHWFCSLKRMPQCLYTSRIQPFPFSLSDPLTL